MTRVTMSVVFDDEVSICRKIHELKAKYFLFQYQALILWVCALIVLSLALYATTPAKDMEWDNQIADNFINSFMRPAWALGVGWLIFACAMGYGGTMFFLTNRQFIFLSLYNITRAI